jgi:hypothetical protein
MLRGVRPMPFLIPLFGMSALFAIVLGWRLGGAWWVLVVVPVVLLGLIVQAMLRGAPGR